MIIINNMIMIMIICIHTIRIYIHAIFHTTYIQLYNSHRSHLQNRINLCQASYDGRYWKHHRQGAYILFYQVNAIVRRCNL